MFANFLIGLREGIEASLIVGILVAYVIKIDRRDLLRWIWAGVSAAVALSLIAGFVLTFATQGLEARVEETIAGILSLLAVGLITWMIFWLLSTAKNIREHLQTSIDSKLSAGGFGIAVVAFLAVAREGLETTLFIWAAVQASGEALLSMLGALIGIAIAIVLGYVIYKGMIRLNLSSFFTWTGALLIIVAAGVLSYGVKELQEAGWIGGEDNLAFDVSGIISEESWYGTLLKGIFNFNAATSWAVFIAWWTYVVVVGSIFTAMTVRDRRARKARDARTPVTLSSPPKVDSASAAR